MGTLTRRTVRIVDDKEDSEGNTLRVRMETVVPFGAGITEQPKKSGCIEISSPAKDECGRPLRKRQEFRIDQPMLKKFRAALVELAGAAPNFAPNGGCVQIRAECGEFVLMQEVPNFGSMPEVKSAYVIGDGGNIRFLFTLDEIGTLLSRLELMSS